MAGFRGLPLSVVFTIYVSVLQNFRQRLFPVSHKIETAVVNVEVCKGLATVLFGPDVVVTNVVVIQNLLGPLWVVATVDDDPMPCFSQDVDRLSCIWNGLVSFNECVV